MTVFKIITLLMIFNIMTSCSRFSTRSVDANILGDGKVLLAGNFTSYNGTSLNRVVLLNNNGSIDTNFNIGTGFNNAVNAYERLSNGKALIGGEFTVFNGTSINRIVRLNSDGSVDSSFSIGSGFDNDVYSMSVQNDGKIIVAGNFTAYNGTSINRIIRLNSDGSVDSGFSVGTGFDNYILTTTIQSDGKIIVAGNFTAYNGTSVNRIIRLNSDGSIDSGFSAGAGFNTRVNKVVLKNNGKIVVAGNFTTYNSTSANGIVQLNASGSIDSSFITGTGFSFSTYSIYVQSDEKVIVGGDFTSYNGSSSARLVRLNLDGSIDANFNLGSGFDAAVYKIVLSDGDKFLIAGDFTTYKTSNVVGRVIRLSAIGEIDNNFSSGTGFNSSIY